MLNELEKEIRDEILDKLEDVEEFEDDAVDMAFKLYEAENDSGSCTCSTYEAIQWIKKHFEDLGDYVDQYEIEYGECRNPFTEPEAFQVALTIFIAENLLANAWNDDNLVDGLKKL